MNVGIQDGLVDPKHADAMGTAVWLYLWCVKCQTKRNGGAFVLGGMPLTYEEISARSGFEAWRIRRWLDRLRKFNYVRVRYLNYKKLRIEITKSKKWTPGQMEMSWPSTPNRLSKNGQSMRTKSLSGSYEIAQSKQKCSLSNRKAGGSLVAKISRGDVSSPGAEKIPIKDLLKMLPEKPDGIGDANGTTLFERNCRKVLA